MIGHKYNAKRTEIDGIKFRSGLEARFYNFFKESQIQIIDYEPVFILQQEFQCRGTKFRPITYKADFTIIYEGDTYIIEAKGMETPEFKLKYKMFMKLYGHENNLLVVKSIKQLKELLSIN